MNELLKYFSLVTFKHTETEGFLTSDISYQNGNQKEGFVRKYQGPHENEIISINSLWELQNPYIKGDLIKCNENVNGFYNSESVVIKHFLTGQYLKIENGKCYMSYSSELQDMEFNF